MRTFARFRLGAARKRQKTVDSRKIDRNQNRKFFSFKLQTVVENTERKGKKSSNGGCKERKDRIVRKGKTEFEERL